MNQLLIAIKLIQTQHQGSLHEIGQTSSKETQKIGLFWIQSFSVPLCAYMSLYKYICNIKGNKTRHMQARFPWDKIAAASKLKSNENFSTTVFQC